MRVFLKDLARAVTQVEGKSTCDDFEDTSVGFYLREVPEFCYRNTELMSSTPMRAFSFMASRQSAYGDWTVDLDPAGIAAQALEHLRQADAELERLREDLKRLTVERNAFRDAYVAATV